MIKGLLRQIEVATGHHSWKSRTKAPAAGDPYTLSTKMSGYSMKLASASRKIKVAEETVQFGLDMLNPRRVSENKGNEVLIQEFKILQHRARMQQADAEYLQQRIEMQLNAVGSIFLLHFHFLGCRSFTLTTNLAKISLLKKAPVVQYCQSEQYNPFPRNRY